MTVPLYQTVKKCADALSRGEIKCPPFPGGIFIELTETVTRSVVFSFNNERYRKKSDVAMGILFRSILANKLYLLAFIKIVCSTANKSQVFIS